MWTCPPPPLTKTSSVPRPPALPLGGTDREGGRQAKGRWDRPTSTASEAKSREFHSTNDRIFPHKAGPMAYENLSGTQVAQKSSERAERRAARRADRKERHGVIRERMEGLCGAIEQERSQRAELEKELEALQQGKPYKKLQTSPEPEEEGWFNKPAPR